MKVYYTQPQEDVLIVNPDRDKTHYEFWVVKPVYVGSARAEAPGRVVSEDGHHFRNLRSAARHILETKGDRALADKLDPYVSKPKTVKVSGMDMVLQGVWAQFCDMRRLNARDKQLMDTSFDLTRDELRRLGMEA